MPSQVPDPFLNQIACLLLLNFRSFYISWILDLSQIHGLQIFCPICGLSFHFVDISFSQFTSHLLSIYSVLDTEDLGITVLGVHSLRRETDM